MLWRKKKEKEGLLGQLQVYECLPCICSVHLMRQGYDSGGDAGGTVASIAGAPQSQDLLSFLHTWKTTFPRPLGVSRDHAAC